MSRVPVNCKSDDGSSSLMGSQYENLHRTEVNEDDTERSDSDVYCRICAVRNAGKMLGIFSNEDENSQIAEKIGRCLPIIVLPTDKLPLSICSSCVTKLNASYDLIITALKAEVFLKAKFLSLFEGSKEDEHYLGKCDIPDNIQQRQNVLDELQDVCDMVLCKVMLDDNGTVTVKRVRNRKCKQSTEKKTNKSQNAPYAKTSEEEYNKNMAFVDGHQPEIYTKDISVSELNINGPATCDICYISFFDMDSFDEHISSHLVKENWKCRLCDSGFQDSNELLAHKMVKHYDSMISCEKCSLTNLNHRTSSERRMCTSESDGRKSQNLNSDRLTIKENMDLWCNICNVAFENRKLLTNHTCKSVEVPTTESLSLDSSQASDNRNLWDKSIDKHICDACGESFATSDELLCHEKRCQNDKESFQCPVCDRRFGKRRTFNMHLKDHNEDMKFDVSSDTNDEKDDSCTGKVKQKKLKRMQCVTCHKIFTNETFYKRHRYIHDPAYWDRYKCKVCSRPFRDAQALANHMQLHAGIKPHMCDLCGRTYNRYANMLKHRKLHKPPNLWEHTCNHCEAKFEKLNDLMAHIERSHGCDNPESEGESSKMNAKQFKWICRFCGKRISTKLSLQDHERIHTGIKPFICEWCGREFRSRPNLLQHHLTHTGDRKHSCEICGKKFARKSFIAQHMRVHTGEKPFECSICGHRFTQAGDMRRHRRRHTEVKLEPAYIVEVPAEEDSVLVKIASR